jgi:hypothetical protein
MRSSSDSLRYKRQPQGEAEFKLRRITGPLIDEMAEKFGPKTKVSTIRKAAFDAVIELLQEDDDIRDIFITLFVDRIREKIQFRTKAKKRKLATARDNAEVAEKMAAADLLSPQSPEFASDIRSLGFPKNVERLLRRAGIDTVSKFMSSDSRIKYMNWQGGRLINEKKEEMRAHLAGRGTLDL